MIGFLDGIGQKIAVGITALLALSGGFGSPKNIVLRPLETANIVQVVTTVTVVAPPVPVTPGLLPVVATSTKYLFTAKKSATAATTAAKPAPKPAASAAASAAAVAAVPAPAIPAKNMTADEFLAQTALSMIQKSDSTYKAALTTKISGGQSISWDLASGFVGGSGSVPRFSFAFSCDPPANPAPIMSNDLSPWFTMRTSYACSVALTPLSGADQRTRTRSFPVQTGPGRLVITGVNTNNVLQNGMNEGGFSFDNQDAKPVTVTGITFDARFTALSTSSGPLVLRFSDARTGEILYDYHMENLPVDTTMAYTQRGKNITIPLDFAVASTTKKLLTIQTLGVHRSLYENTKPTISIMLDGISTNVPDAQPLITSPEVAWSCLVVLNQYDPNTASLDQPCQQ